MSPVHDPLFSETRRQENLQKESRLFQPDHGCSAECARGSISRSIVDGEIRS